MKYIPQSAPFEMIDTLLSYDNGVTVTQLTITSTNIFAENGYFLEAGLLENMAQSAASGTGYLAHKEGKQPPVGFIGAIKGFKLNRLPKVGETIITTVQPTMTIGNVQVIEAKVCIGQEEIACAEYKIFLQEEQ